MGTFRCFGMIPSEREAFCFVYSLLVLLSRNGCPKELVGSTGFPAKKVPGAIWSRNFEKSLINSALAELQELGAAPAKHPVIPSLSS